ncbi:MAG: 4Fe-4S dicluster domain-containing protein [Planctomycetota bacterium]
MKNKAQETFKLIGKKDLNGFIAKLIKGNKYRVAGVVAKDGRYAFDDLTPISGTGSGLADASEFCPDYDVTLLPPKKYLYPQKETYLKFDKDNGKTSFDQIVESKPTILVGVHPYDIKAIELMDKVFAGDYPDPNYLAKRQNTIIIGMDCLNPSPKSFSGSMETNTVSSGFDLMLTDIGKDYLVEIGTDKGAELLVKYAKPKNADSKSIALRDKVRAKATGKYKLAIDGGVNALAKTLANNYEHPYWNEIGEKCLSCSSCTMVCPTCVCFDVMDDTSIDLKSGSRARQWDSCMVQEFAKVGTGENFREHKNSRARHRIFRKGKYMLERFKVQGCVGCGRCINACLAEIASPVDAYNRLTGGKK